MIIQVPFSGCCFGIFSTLVSVTFILALFSGLSIVESEKSREVALSGLSFFDTVQRATIVVVVEPRYFDRPKW